MTFRLAIANLKGGVGKSTTTLFLAETLAAFHDLAVLVVDLDPQSNASFMLLSRDGLEQAEASGKTLTHFLLDTADNKPRKPAGYVWPNASDLIELRGHLRRGRVDVLASVPKMWFVELVREKRSYLENIDPAVELCRSLDEYLRPLEPWYDVIIYDCPPGFSSLTRAGLLSVQAVISPTIADPVSVRSLGDFVDLGMTDFLKMQNDAQHYVIVSKYRTNTEHGDEANRLKKRYDVLEPYVKESVDMTRATQRIRMDSFRTYNEKFGSLRSDLRRLTQSVFQYVIN